MAKSLGQIHTANYQFNETSGGLAAQDSFLVDVPGTLTVQLQHMVRMMSSFKVVGIDMAIDPFVDTNDISAAASGRLLYYAPTKGRVEALKKAYMAVRRMMKIKGIVPSHNLSYDFRPPLVDPNHSGGLVGTIQNGTDFVNQASIEDNGLASCLANGPAGSSNIFGIYNQGIQPRQAVGAGLNFEDGFNTGLRSNADSDDFVLNGEVTVTSAESTASEELEVINWDVAYAGPNVVAGVGEVSQRAATADEFLWRPDPALYLSVLTGQFVLAIDSITAVDSAGADQTDSISLSLDVHVAGWKGILGNKKRRSSKKMGKKNGRRHSKR